MIWLLVSEGSSPPLSPSSTRRTWTRLAPFYYGVNQGSTWSCAVVMVWLGFASIYLEKSPLVKPVISQGITLLCVCALSSKDLHMSVEWSCIWTTFRLASRRLIIPLIVLAVHHIWLGRVALRMLSPMILLPLFSSTPSLEKDGEVLAFLIGAITHYSWDSEWLFWAESS